MKYVMPEIENIKKDFKEFIKSADEFIKKQKQKTKRGKNGF